jgi:SAM-dependent methyltransferase
MSYYDNFNPDLLRYIPPDARVVLEIGCGAGALCEAYRRVNPQVDWIGVEPNDRAARLAIDRGVKVQPIRVEQFVLSRVPIRHEFDCLILGDVLEHLDNPWDALECLVDYLHPGAQVLASIPNVGHWTIIRDLLNGRWDYQDEGLLDRTHLRFFTRSSIKAMFEAAGLYVFEMRGRDLFNEGFEEWYDSEFQSRPIKPLMARTNELRAFQYIVRAIKPRPVIQQPDGSWAGTDELVKSPFAELQRHDPLHIHAITAEECCARPRIREPFAMLETIPGVRCTAGLDNGTPHPPGQIMVQQRFRSLSIGAQRLHLQAGWLIVAEIDDDPQGLFRGPEPQALLGNPVVHEEGSITDIFGWLQCCHAVCTTTEVMAETLREYNPNVFVFPNQIAHLEPFPEKATDAIRIIFAAQNRQADWAPIMDAINRVHFDHVRAELPPLHFTVVHDREFFDALKVNHKFFQTFLPYESYRRLLRTQDIALLPLEPTRFNRHKSDLKFVECAAEGVAVLASETVYGDTLRFHRDDCLLGAIYGSAESFERILRKLIGQRSMVTSGMVRHDMALNAYAYIRDHRLLSQHYRKLHEWYLSLLNSRQALHDSLLARCPEIGSVQPQPDLQGSP